MKIEEAIAKKLQASTGVFALVRDRVYAGELPEKPVMPAICFYRRATVRDHSHDGPDGLPTVTFKIDCLGKKYSECREIADAVRAELDGFKGVAGGVGGVEIDAAFALDEELEYDDDIGLHWITTDYAVTHVET